MNKKEHVHKYRKVGRTLWCVCRLTQRIECAHRWRFDRKDDIQITREGASRSEARNPRLQSFVDRPCAHRIKLSKDYRLISAPSKPRQVVEQLSDGSVRVSCV
jgi:hypothetical protein